ncbi:MAG: MFS transporter [Pirellulales bacterium]
MQPPLYFVHRGVRPQGERYRPAVSVLLPSRAMPPTPPSIPPATKGTPREVFAWAIYDWANSAYTTLSITVMMIFVTEIVAGPQSSVADDLTRWATALGQNVARDSLGEVIWAWGLAVAMLVAAVLSPLAGAMADARATKRWWLAGTAFGGALCPIIMSVLPNEFGWTQLALFILGSLLFDLSFGFYNGFLPELADEKTMNRVSAWGFALGYLGGGIALLIQLGVFHFGRQQRIDDSQLVAAGLFLMGAWWGLFTIPTIVMLRDRALPTGKRMPLGRAAIQAVSRVRTTLSRVSRYRTLALFLLAFLFYNDGIQTAIVQAGTFAKKDLGFAREELLLVILVFQFICLAGALIDSVLTDRLGQKRALMLYLGIWAAALAAALVIDTKLEFWLLSIVLGLVMGGAQTVSRSIMAMMTPERQRAEFFGFFNFSGKATSWLGNFVFGAVILATGKTRIAVASLLVFFLIGLLLVSWVDVARGRREALAELPPPA